MDKKYYVYVHRCASDGSIFYVGKGTNRRAYSDAGRTKEWLERSAGGYTVEIIRGNLTNTHAIELEKLLYLENLESVVNKVEPVTVPILRYAYLSSLFEITENSDSFLAWKTDAPKLNKGISRVRGKRAGRLSSGYWVIRLFQKSIKVHRIVHCLSIKQDLDCDLIVDHIDGNRANNNPLNLRSSTYAHNARNKKNGSTRKNEDTGITGVIRVKLGEYDYYMTQWQTLDSKNRSKSFSILTLGKEEAFRLACEYRAKMIAELNLQGAGYTERHGT